MPRKIEENALTALQIENAQPRAVEWAISDGGGLSVVIRPDGRKRFLYRYSVHGRRGKQWLGYYPDTGLAEARVRRDEAAERVEKGEDPRVARRIDRIIKREAAATTFEAIARSWWEKRRAKWTDDHADRVLNSLVVDVFPDLGPLPVAQVTAPLILAVVKRVEARGAVETAQRILQRIGGVMRYAIATTNGIVSVDPTYRLSEGLTTIKVEHRPAMPKSELPEFYRRLEAEPVHPLTRYAMELLALTFVRPGKEFRFACWDEFDFKAREWRIPGARVKMRDPHIVPLSKQAIAVLEAVKPYSRRSELVFPSQHDPRKPISENTLSYCLGRLGYSGIHCPHGFRSLASTVLNEQGFNSDHIERQLAHAPKNKVRAAYNRAEYLAERRQMMTWWGNFIDAQRKAAKGRPAARKIAA
jgi:integrase